MNVLFVAPCLRSSPSQTIYKDQKLNLRALNVTTMNADNKRYLDKITKGGNPVTITHSNERYTCYGWCDEIAEYEISYPHRKPPHHNYGSYLCTLCVEYIEQSVPLRHDTFIAP